MAQYSAKDLFSTWYSTGLKKEIASDELTYRRTSIEVLLKEEDPTFWVDILKICFKESVSEEGKAKFVKFFKDVDFNFQVQNNENLLQTLACCVVAEKIQANETYLSDSLSLAVLTSLFIGKGDSIQISDFVAISKEFWQEECLRKRMQPDIEIKSNTLSLGKVEFKQPPASAEFADEVKGYLGKASKDLMQLHQAQNQLQKLTTTVEMLSEESNVLWWLFGSFSRDKDSRFDQIGYPESLIRIGKELSDLTTILPGLANIDSIISKSISINLNGKDKEELKFSDFINSVPVDIELTIASHYKEQFSTFTPCISSIKLRSEFSDGKNNAWQNLAASKYKIKPDSTNKPIVFAKQLYLEIMLNKAVNSL